MNTGMDIDKQSTNFDEILNAKADLEIGRHTNSGAHAGVYFSSAAQLKCSDVVISDQSDPEIFGDSSSLKLMDKFLVEQGTWQRNHLAVNLFAVVDDGTNGRKRKIEGSVLVEEVPVGNNTVVYDFFVSPGLKSPDIYRLKGRKIANFVSNVVSEKEVSDLITNSGYVPVYHPKLKPLFYKSDDSHHGESLALDTASANVDLFFSLIRKSAHREDLRILGMGMRYYSSYDACDQCLEKIYSSRVTLMNKLARFAEDGKYNLGPEGNKSIPFYSLFYSARPYIKSSYSIYLKDKEHFHAAAKYSYEYGNPTNCHLKSFKLDHLQTLPFSERDSKELLLKTTTDIESDPKVYFYVDCFEPERGEGIPIRYNYNKDSKCF